MIVELSELDCLEVVIIFHDRDLDEDGELRELHCHFIIRFENARSYETTLQVVQAEPRNFAKMRNEAASYRYLTHTTDEAMNAKKYRYSIDDLHVFVKDDGADKLRELSGEEREQFYMRKIVGKAVTKVDTEETVADFLYDLADGLYIENWEIKDQLIEDFGKTTGVLTWTKNKKHFENARLEYYEKKFRDWKERGRKFQAIYINGPSGLGKTTLANKLARAINQQNDRPAGLIHDAPNATEGTRYDFVQDYRNELVTVFDDLSPNVFSYMEFLNLFESDKVARANSRFENKPWFAEYAFITRSQSFEDWTRDLSLKELKGKREGSEEYENVVWQPRRRFNLVIEADFEKAELCHYKKTSKNSNAHEREVLKTITFGDRQLVKSKELQEEIISSVLEILSHQRMKKVS